MQKKKSLLTWIFVENIDVILDSERKLTTRGYKTLFEVKECTGPKSVELRQDKKLYSRSG